MQPREAEYPRRSPRRFISILTGLVLLSAVVLGIKYGRYYVLPRRFAVVEPGRLYRSGYCEPGPLTRVIREHKLKTILTFLSDSPKQRDEANVARDEGVAVLRIPMPGDGCGSFEQLDAAAAAMADPSKQPILVHCWSGVNRTGAAYVAYRLRYCGWSLDEAMAEAEKYGYSPESTPQLKEHLRAYAKYVAGDQRPTDTHSATRADD